MDGLAAGVKIGEVGGGQEETFWLLLNSEAHNRVFKLLQYSMFYPCIAWQSI